MSTYWYALHSHPHKEDALYHQAKNQGIEVFYPCLKVAPVNPRSRKIRPYFPGYLFVRADLNGTGLSLFQWMPNSSGLVSFGGEPAVVPDSLIVTIQHRLEEIKTAGGELFDGLKKGDPVMIQDGPFAGYEAIFDMRLTGSERVRVLLKMLSDRTLPVELRAAQIQRIKKK